MGLFLSVRRQLADENEAPSQSNARHCRIALLFAHESILAYRKETVQVGFIYFGFLKQSAGTPFAAGHRPVLRDGQCSMGLFTSRCLLVVCQVGSFNLRNTRTCLSSDGHSAHVAHGGPRIW